MAAASGRYQLLAALITRIRSVFCDLRDGFPPCGGATANASANQHGCGHCRSEPELQNSALLVNLVGLARRLVRRLARRRLPAGILARRR